MYYSVFFFFFQAEDGIRDAQESRGLGDVYKRQIQDRYSKYKLTDPERQKMNPELMALYKAKGINPASGCVPMLLTFPILFAFYAMLNGAIELRGAPFMWWIHDLSLRDGTFILPLLMGATMFWQQ